MTTPQQPLETGFGPRPDAIDLVADVDLTGKLAIVTGGYSGLGIETVAALASAGASVVVPARRVEVARAALDARNLHEVEVAALDLSDLESVRSFAQSFLASGRSIDILINNAAIMASPQALVGPGWESQFATNHLGHYVLVNLLWPALVAEDGARVVALSSTGHKLSPIRFDDPHFAGGSAGADADGGIADGEGRYDKWLAYGQAKTANSLFAVELDRLGGPFGVRAFAVHPGGIMTELQRHLPKAEMVAAGWINEEGVPREGFKTTEQGAGTSVWAATSPVLAGMGGVYCEDCNIASPTDPTDPLARFRGVDAHAIDPEAATRLWALSAQLTGVNAFAG